MSKLNRLRWMTMSTLLVSVLLNGQFLQAQTAIYYIHPDHLGTPQVMTDANQTVVWQADYDPFGEANIIVETVTNNVRFPGQYFDQETNLHYNLNRDYDPGIGRYIESDPIGLEGGNNTYAYVGNNPIVRTDPLGLKDGCPTGTAPDERNICRPFAGRDEPCNNASCAADLPFFIEPDTRSQSEVECDDCLFTCNTAGILTPAPLPTTILKAIGFGTVSGATIGVCRLICKDECSSDCP